jgi:hypothetical protein
MPAFPGRARSLLGRAVLWVNGIEARRGGAKTPRYAGQFGLNVRLPGPDAGRPPEAPADVRRGD